MSRSTHTAPPSAEAQAAAGLSPDVVQFWHSYVAQQLAAGRRDLGQMVESALQHLYRRSMAELGVAQHRLEQIQAFRHALQDEMVRIEALDLNEATPQATLPVPHPAMGLSFVPQPVAEGDAAAAVRRVLLPAPLRTGAQVLSYKAVLQEQYDGATQQLASGHERLNVERRQLAVQTATLSGPLYTLGRVYMRTLQIQPLRPTLPVVLPAGDGPRPALRPRPRPHWGLSLLLANCWAWGRDRVRQLSGS